MDQFIPEPMSGCWIWTGARQQSGYGTIWSSEDGHSQRAHRIAYRLFVGPVPDDALVCHRCDLPCCVNPAHLFLGTSATNNADMIRKGRERYPSGPNAAQAKLTAEQVREVRRRYAAGGISLAGLAREYGFPYPATVHAIVQRRTYREVPA